MRTLNDRLDMSTATLNTDDALMLALQRGVPLTARPFADVGRELGLTGEDVLRTVRDLFDAGVVRRFGAVFDSRHLGYGSTLCAVDVPDEDLERAAALLEPHPGVTHCYQREGRPNLWFTLTARADRFDGELRAMVDRLAPYTVLNLPAIRRFKVEVVLDAPADGPAAAPVRSASEWGADVASRDFTDRDKALIRALQGNIPVTAQPFHAVAGEISWDADSVLSRLTEWQRDGILRRVGIILRHRNAGFVANGMCVWRVPSSDVERLGQRIARTPEVTHCYERPSSSLFPYNLYAMVHARKREVAQGLFTTLSEQTGVKDGKILMSLREFKKSSPVFFCEDDEVPGGAG